MSGSRTAHGGTVTTKRCASRSQCPETSPRKRSLVGMSRSSPSPASASTAATVRAGSSSTMTVRSRYPRSEPARRPIALHADDRDPAPPEGPDHGNATRVLDAEDDGARA